LNTGIDRLRLAVAAELGLTLTPQALDRLARYEQLILEWNRRVNLMSRRDTHRIAGYHFLDSLTACAFLPQGGRVCDLGSGAGFPGIPLKIVRDDISMVLIESVRKKALFLDSVIRELGLNQTQVRNVRVEPVPKGNPPSAVSRQPGPEFDVVLSRLVGSIRDVVRFAVPLLGPGGIIVCYKSSTAETEIKQAQPVMNRLRLEVREIADRHFTRPTAFLRRLVVVGRAEKGEG
jgi:16S rRNA (guanine527-N7)-methyltransferase